MPTLLGRVKAIVAGHGLTAAAISSGLTTFDVVESELDHGGLAGLADDDHTQYHTDARGDARYWQLSTDLATQAELDALAAIVDAGSAGRWELVMQDGVTGPPVPVETEAQDDWVYAWVEG